MSWIQVIVLAVVQGVTEFLPISSSAHLILFSKWLGWPDQGLSFDMAVHAGSLMAVIAYLRHDLAELARGALSSKEKQRGGESRSIGHLAWPIALATVPVAIAGLLIQDWVASDGRSVWVLGWTSVIFALLLWTADRWGSRQVALEQIGWRQVVGMGFAQALALIPGTSRSGVTMTAGLAQGLTREAAARLSFLLAVPVGLLVAAKDALDLGLGGLGHPLQAAVGFVISAVTAFAAIGWLLRWLKRRGMIPFVIYRLILGVVLLAEAWRS